MDDTRPSLAELELLIKEREVKLKDQEIRAKEREIANSRWATPLVIGLFAAALGLAGNIIVAAINNKNTAQVERVRAQSTLVLEAIKAQDTNGVCKNLTFFVSLGLIEDSNRTIDTTCPDTTKGVPMLPTSPALPRSPENVRVLVTDLRGNALPGATVLLDDGQGNYDNCPETSADGQCRLPPLPMGDTVHLVIKKEGYFTREISGIWRGQPIVVTLRAR